MKPILDSYYRALQLLLTVLMGALIVPVSMQVLSRYTGLVPRYIWTEEIARFCFIWIVMVGSMIAVRDGSHFDVDLLPKPKTVRNRGLSDLFVHLFMIAFALVFVIFGWDFFMFGRYQDSEIAELPLMWIYSAWPLAGITWTIFLIEKIREDIQRVMTSEPTDAEGPQ
jgi:TRAP-type C4-dicarboxylate transport system permease small subunit